MSKSIKSVTVKNLSKTSTLDSIDRLFIANALTPAITVASVEAYDKVIAKATKAPSKAKATALFAPDGVTRVSVAFNNAALAISGDAKQLGTAQLALASVNQSMSERMRIVWSFGGFTTETTPSQAFKALIAMGYLPEGSLAGLSESERAANMVTYGKPRHPVYGGLSNTHWKQLEHVKTSKARAESKKAVVSTEAKGLTDAVSGDAVATDLHVKATCSKFMQMNPTLTQRSALIKEMAALLGFSVSGIKSL